MVMKALISLSYFCKEAYKQFKTTGSITDVQILHKDDDEVAATGIPIII
jgi:hypothetical protein